MFTTQTHALFGSAFIFELLSADFVEAGNKKRTKTAVPCRQAQLRQKNWLLLLLAPLNHQQCELPLARLFAFHSAKATELLAAGLDSGNRCEGGLNLLLSLLSVDVSVLISPQLHSLNKLLDSPSATTPQWQRNSSSSLFLNTEASQTSWSPSVPSLLKRTGHGAAPL